METNLILEEVWRVKDELDHDAEQDLHRFCENTRAWAAEHQHDGPLISNPEELREFCAIKHDQRAAKSTLVSSESSPRCLLSE